MNSTYELMQDADNIAEQACPCAGGADYSAVRNIVSRHVDAIEQEVADGYMKLPVGEDGEVWHIGDVVEWCDGMTAEVIAVGDNTLYYIDDGADAVDWTQADTKRHHHVPTVEDLLRELVHRWGESTDPDAYISEYAAKLQLADDAAEHIGSK